MMSKTRLAILITVLLPLQTNALGTFGFFSAPEQDNLVLACSGAASADYMRIYRSDDSASLASPLDLPGSSGTATAFSRDGRYFALGLSASPWLAIYNTSNWKLLTNPTGLNAAPNAIAFNNSGSRLAVVSATTPAIIVYDTGSWTSIIALATTVANPSQAVAFNPADTLMAVGSNTNTPVPYLTVYNTSSWTTTTINTAPTTIVRGVEFNKNGDLAVVGGTSGANSFLWVYANGTIGTMAATVGVNPASPAYSVAFSQDATKLAVGTTAAIKIYDPIIITNPPYAVTITSGGTINGLTFSKKGDRLAAAHTNAPYLSVFETTSAYPSVNPAPTGLPSAACKDASYTP